MKYVITVEGETFEIEMGRGEMVWVNRRLYTVDLQGIMGGSSDYSLLVDNRSYEAHAEESEGGECQMVVAGRPYRARLEQQGHDCPKVGAAQSAFTEAVARQGLPQVEVCAPLPGLLVAMTVEVGQRVKPGEVVAVLESMKMNLELHAPWGGVVQTIQGTPGAEVGQGEVLVVIEPDRGSDVSSPCNSV